MKQQTKRKAVSLISTALITLSVCGVGYGTYTLATEAGDQTNVSVVVPEVVETAAGNQIYITLVSTSADIFFDGAYGDEEGSVWGNRDSDDECGFDITGTLHGYTFDEFSSVTPILQVDQDHREAYEYLVNNKYIEEPEFESLGVISDYTTSALDNSFYWLAPAASNGNRMFRLRYTYEYGSFFHYMNPSEFFDSTYSNGNKKGNEYTVSEKREILSCFEALNEATYTLYLDVATTENTYSVTIDANGGYFSVTDTSTTSYTITGLTYHSKIDPITPYKSKYSFNGWTYNSSLYNGSFYLSDAVSENTSSTAVTFTASYTSTSSTLTVSYTNSDNKGSAITFNVFNSDGMVTYTSSYSGTTSFSLEIGSIITVTSTTYVTDVSAGTGITLTSSNSYQITASTCTLYVTPEAVDYYTLNITVNSISTGSHTLTITYYLDDVSTTYTATSKTTATLTVDSNSTVSVSYKKSGSYYAIVTVTDASGTSTEHKADSKGSLLGSSTVSFTLTADQDYTLETSTSS